MTNLQINTEDKNNSRRAQEYVSALNPEFSHTSWGHSPNTHTHNLQQLLTQEWCPAIDNMTVISDNFA